MKKLVVLSVFAFLIIAPSSFAQKNEGEMKVKHEKKMNHMEEELDLTDDQRKQIEAIHAKYKPQEEANKKEMEKLRGERKEIKEAKRAEVKAILTPDQLKKMEELKKEHKKKEAHDRHMKREKKVER